MTITPAHIERLEREIEFWKEEEAIIKERRDLESNFKSDQVDLATRNIARLEAFKALVVALDYENWKLVNTHCPCCGGWIAHDPKCQISEALALAKKALEG